MLPQTTGAKGIHRIISSAKMTSRSSGLQTSTCRWTHSLEVAHWRAVRLVAVARLPQLCIRNNDIGCLCRDVHAVLETPLSKWHRRTASATSLVGAVARMTAINRGAHPRVLGDCRTASTAGPACGRQHEQPADHQCQS